jgi:hypothetical protein
MLCFNGLSEINSLIVSISPMLLAQTSIDLTGATNWEVIIAILGFYAIFCFFNWSFLSWKILQRINVKNAWFAWIPILNVYITFVAGDVKYPALWTILFVMPWIGSIFSIVSIVRFSFAWSRICKKLEKSSD